MTLVGVCVACNRMVFACECGANAHHAVIDLAGSETIAAGVARWKRGTHCDRSDLESLRQALADARTEAAEQRIRAEAAEAELRSLRQEVAR